MNNNGEMSFFEDFRKNAGIVAFNKEQKANKEEVYLKGRNKLVIKEEFIAYGESKLNDFDLLALLFNENLLNKLKENGINTLFKLNMQSEEDMKKIGISKNNSIKLNALISLCKRGVKKETSEQMDSPKKIYDLCKDLEDEDQEILRLICLNTKNKVIYQEDIFKGGLNTSIAHPREILKAGLKCSAANIIIVHNHPSGDPTPSKEDINITVRIKEAATIIGIDLLDHIVIGKNKYVSLKEKGII